MMEESFQDSLLYCMMAANRVNFSDGRVVSRVVYFIACWRLIELTLVNGRVVSRVVYFIA